MFNGRNRFNGFTTEKPVCVLRLDSAGTEVKRKSAAPKIQCNRLILKAFLHLTELKYTVLEGVLEGRQAAICSPNICRHLEPSRGRNRLNPPYAKGRRRENGRPTNHLRAYTNPSARPANHASARICRSPMHFMAILQARRTLSPDTRFARENICVHGSTRIARTHSFIRLSLALSNGRRERPLSARPKLLIDNELCDQGST
jgi:hypothetical protein